MNQLHIQPADSAHRTDDMARCAYTSQSGPQLLWLGQIHFRSVSIGYGYVKYIHVRPHSGYPHSAVYTFYQNVKNVHVVNAYSSIRARHKMATSINVNVFHILPILRVSNTASSSDVHPMHLFIPTGAHNKKGQKIGSDRTDCKE